MHPALITCCLVWCSNSPAHTLSALYPRPFAQARATANTPCHPLCETLIPLHSTDTSSAVSSALGIPSNPHLGPYHALGVHFGSPRTSQDTEALGEVDSAHWRVPRGTCGMCLQTGKDQETAVTFEKNVLKSAAPSRAPIQEAAPTWPAPDKGRCVRAACWARRPGWDGRGKAFVGGGRGAPTKAAHRRSQHMWGTLVVHWVARDVPPSREGPGCLGSAGSQAFVPEHSSQMILGVVGGEAELQPREIWGLGCPFPALYTRIFMHCFSWSRWPSPHPLGERGAFVPQSQCT